MFSVSPTNRDVCGNEADAGKLNSRAWVGMKKIREQLGVGTGVPEALGRDMT